MPFVIHQAFTLIENGHVFDVANTASFVSTKKLTTHSEYCAVNHMKYLNFDYSKLTSDDSIVMRLLQLMSLAQFNNIPLILNRTGQRLFCPNTTEPQTIPQHFCIGFLTSGTTGQPKLIFKQFESLAQKKSTHTHHRTKRRYDSKWLLCYHPFSFAGIQVILHTVLGGETLVSQPMYNVTDLALAADRHAVNGISATPSLFKSLLLVWGKSTPDLSVITFGGEVCGQDLLSLTAQLFPNASIRHIYATTETGVIMTVDDGLAGFAKNTLDDAQNGWGLTIENEQLVLTKDTCVVKTGDMLIENQARYYFVGRIDNVVNVGGEKVNLEAIERQLTSLQGVSDACVYAKANPITGNLICADVVLCDPLEHAMLVINEWKRSLIPAQRPRIVKPVDFIQLSDTGKKIRTRA